MTDDDLSHIFRDLSIPEPSETARRDALIAARAEFSRAQEENEKNRQGNSQNLRPMNGTTTKGRFIMSVLSGKHKTSLALISLTGLAVAIGVTMHATSSLTPGRIAYETPDGAPIGDVTVDKRPYLDFGKFSRLGEKAENPPVPAPITQFSMAPAAPPPPTNIEKKSQSLDSILKSQPEQARRDQGLFIAADKAKGNAQNGAAMAGAPAAEMMTNSAPASTMARMKWAPGNDGAAVAPSYLPSPVDSSNASAYQGDDQFPKAAANPVKLVQAEPVSTFSVDVDTASYSFLRRELNEGQLPPADAVRIEEVVNYFDYKYALPESKKEPFKPTVALYPSPWSPGKLLMHIGIKGYDLPKAEKPRSNLVFLIDTSGSMESQDRLPLIQSAFKLMLSSLRPDDTVGIVTYAGNAGVALEPTKVADRAKIVDAIDHLTAGGSTAGADGIKTAYQLAEQHFDKEGVNRVLLATDGDFNVGISDQDGLKQLIAKERDSGIFLSVLGVGQGNYHDSTMQTLAQNGNGTASYLDSLSEARKVLVEEASSTLFTIAQDVKLQVEFNPKRVAEYRLLGYETRQLAREDFNNDKVDAGDVGSGHAVTAIYEVTLVGSAARAIDDLRYGQPAEPAQVRSRGVQDSSEYAFLKIRYKLPTESASHLITRPIVEADRLASLDKASGDVRFAASVAGFGLLLKHDTGLGQFSYADDANIANSARGDDADGYRSEFVKLVHLAGSLDHAGGAPAAAPRGAPEPTE